ncbi:MAG TPA: hypothetical protein VIY49_12465 [Bryobacteraceae bacterium]
MTGRRACFITGLLTALLGLVLQLSIVQLRYGGNWTALFCTGSAFPVPPALSGEHIYVFQHSTGYDGQMYHYVAHDPLLKTGILLYMDNPRVRYRRILLPATAFLLGLGQSARIDSAYVAANLLFLFLGAWWLSQYFDSLRLPAGWAAGLVVTPAALISLDRLTVDLAFTALCIGFALYVHLGQNAKACVALALGCMARETGFMLAGAACLALAMERRFAKGAAFAAAALPAAAWWLYVNAKTPDYSNEAFQQLIPFKGLWETFLHPLAYPFSAPVNTALGLLDRIGLLAFVLGGVFSIWLVRRKGLGPLEMAMVLWTLVGLCLPRFFWEDSFSGSRVFTPLLIYVMLRGFPVAGGKALAPLLFAIPRILLQVAGPLAVELWTRAGAAR